MSSTGVISYKRSRFSTRLPDDRVYAPSHFWLLETEPGVWRIGFTKFAIRMLGDFVEHDFAVKPGAPIRVGEAIGWVEGFKAVTELYAVVGGEFLEPNADLKRDITLADRDPYGAGWLYSVRGTPDPNAVDVQGYVEILDLTIDKMQSESPAGGARETAEPVTADDNDPEKDPTCPH